jgi:hypothetical protein
VSRVVLVPGVLALSPRYASVSDPVADLRHAVLAALEWAGADGRRIRVVGSDQGHAVIEELIREAFGTVSETAPETLVVVANGSAKRTEKAPGHFDERALRFDDQLREWLTVDPCSLGGVDRAVADELWADVEALPELGEALAGGAPELIGIDYDADPYGVKYWVMRWEIG